MKRAAGAINKHLAKELEVQQLRNKIQTEVQDSVQQSQRDYYLREQMKAIQKELGDLDDTQKDIAELQGEDRSRRHARGDQEGRSQGARPAGSDEPHGGGLLADPQLHRVAGRAALVEVARPARSTS